MKRFICLVCALCLILPTALAEERLSIVEVREAAPDRWTQTYTTPWRDVAIDTSVFLPQADTLPVITVGYDLREVASASGKYDAKRTLGGSVDIQTDNVSSHGGEPTIDEYFAPYDDFLQEHGEDFFGDFITDTQQMLADCGLSDVTFNGGRPYRICAYRYKGKKGAADTCKYMVELHQTLNGIPILAHAFMGLPNTRYEGKGGEYFGDPCMSLWYLNSDHISLSGNLMRETGRIADDIPLCSFDTVKATLEEEIMAGHIRHVYEIELGYILYNVAGATKDPGPGGRDLAAYYAVPTWYVHCIRMDSTKKSWKPSKDKNLAARSDLNARYLLIDAQSGDILTWSKKQGRGAADYRGIVTWEDIQ